MNAKYFKAKPEPILYPEGPEGPEICNLKMAEGKRLYYARIHEMAARQNEACALCHRFLIAPTFDHERSRKLGQDDRTTYPDGTWRNAALCLLCNTLKGSRRYQWVNGKYVPFAQETA